MSVTPVQPPVTQYTRSGDIYLAYQVLGDGPVTLLFVNGFISHLDIIWEEPGLAQFLNRLASLARVILFDKRGVGLSDRIGAAPSLDDTIEDILAVLKAVDCDQVALMSVSEGGPAAVLFAGTYPKRVTHLILYGTMPKFTRSYDYPWALSRSQYDQWLNLMVENWGSPVSLAHFAPSRADDVAFQAWWAKVLRLGATPGSVKDILEVLRDIDVRPALPHIHVPALVLHRIHDKAIPLSGGRLLANGLPNARFVELQGQDHWWWVGDTDPILRKIEQFLDDPILAADNVPAPQPVGSLTARELEVLQLLAAGYTNRQIAEALVITTGTVKSYTNKIYSKLNVANRTQAIVAARKLGLAQ